MDQDILELTWLAFDNGALVPLLKGEAPYRLPVSRFIPGDVPVDWDSLLRLGILPCCERDATGERWGQFKDAVSALIGGSAEEVWCAYNVYFYLCYASEGGKHPIPALEEFPLEELRAGLERHRLALNMSQKWTGKGMDEGLWGDIWYADAALRRRYGMGVLRP